MHSFEIISLIGAAGYLVPCTISDLRRRSIPLSLGIGGCLCSAFWMLVQVLAERESWGGFLAAGVPGMTLMGLSLLSGGRIGMGDGVVLFGLGLFLGGRQTFSILLTGLLLSSFWSVVLLIRKKAGWKSRIPWIPFLLAGYVGLLIRDVGTSLL